MLDRIEWLGHGSFCIQGEPLIYIDPWRVARTPKSADIILISHDHYDHCSPADIDKLRGESTAVIANSSVDSLVNGVTLLRAWQAITFDRICIKAIPAYNSHHPKEFGGLGYVISIDQYDIYYAGDTDLIPEMSSIRPDIAILPIGGRQTMDVARAIEAVQVLRPRWVIPSHYGSASEGGTNIDAKIFADRVESAGLAKVALPARRV